MRLVALCCVAVCIASPASAYEAITRAGLTERAALQSSLHERLQEEFGRSLGLYEALKLPQTNRTEDRPLASRLTKLDPEGGYAPVENTATALSWLVAGAVIEGVGVDRQQNHFFDPTSGRGLTDGGGLRTRLAGLASGVRLEGRGLSIIEWLSAPRAVNDWGLIRYYDERKHAVTATSPAEREGALTRSLMAAGAVVALVEQAADPAHVRNDYRRNYEELGAPFERYVADKFGRTGLPALRKVLAPRRLADLIHASDGSGLADHTASGFFSPGTLPGSGRAAPLIAQPSGQIGYLSGAVPHLVAYRRTKTGFVYWLDDRCLSDYAEALLPEAGGTAEAALEFLFRGRLAVAVEGTRIALQLREVTTPQAEVALFWDDAAGDRHPLGASQRFPLSDAAPLSLDVRIPTEARRIAALVTGVDKAGEAFVVSTETKASSIIPSRL
jgi:hypothetical protein